MGSAFSPGRRLAVAGLLAVFLLGPCLAAAAARATPISLELNKLQPLAQGTGCRAYFVIANPGSQAIPELDLDLVLFGTDGVIARRVAIEFGPLPAEKTVVRLFDLAGTPCDSIGQILLNDVISCRTGVTAPDADQRASCLARIALSSLAKVKLTR